MSTDTYARQNETINPSPDTDRLAALLHELGIGCALAPHGPHTAHADRLLDSGVTIAPTDTLTCPHGAEWDGRIWLKVAPTDTLRQIDSVNPSPLREAAKAFIDDPIDLMDADNAPAGHGEWRPAHRPMGDTSVILEDDDGCNLFVDALDVSYLVNGAVAIRAALATSEEAGR